MKCTMNLNYIELLSNIKYTTYFLKSVSLNKTLKILKIGGGGNLIDSF